MIEGRMGLGEVKYCLPRVCGRFEPVVEVFSAIKLGVQCYFGRETRLAVFGGQLAEVDGVWEWVADAKNCRRMLGGVKSS
jgi:hypothetical protein